jgi:sigma-B regulation protein RsbU (phosphoserine phosphatase)
MGGDRIDVLLVEDNPGDARLIQEMLAEARGRHFALAAADRLEAGLRLLAGGRFDVALLDLSLPDSQGLATFRVFRAGAPGVPVVVLTGLDDETVAARAVEEGAQDYLVKGQVDTLQLVHALRFAIGRYDRARDTEAQLAIARKVHQGLLPDAPPEAVGFDIHGACFPAEATGGDYFDYLRLADGRLGVVVGDVTGHGLGPALLMASTRAYLRAFARTHADAGAILAQANRVLADDLPDDRNVTLLLAELDCRSRSFRFASAGHQPGFILAPGGVPRARLGSTGMPLGIEPEGDFAAGPATRLEPGEIVVLLTDGVVDAESPAGDRFGNPRVLEVVRANRGQSARAIVEALHQAVRDFVQDLPQRDDITLIVIKSEPEGEERPAE